MHFFSFYFGIFRGSRLPGTQVRCRPELIQEAVLPSEFLSLLTNCRVKSLIWRLLVK